MTLRIKRAGILKFLLAAAALGIAAESLLGRDTEPAGGAVAAATSQKRAAAPSGVSIDPASIDLDALGRPVTADVQDNLFFIPPPPAPPQRAAPVVRQAEAPPPPPKPTAPPLPFQFLGRFIDRGATVVFVSHNGQSLSLKQGDVAANLYRVERITPTEVVFLYEPLAERQMMQLEPIN